MLMYGLCRRIIHNLQCATVLSPWSLVNVQLGRVRMEFSALAKNLLLGPRPEDWGRLAIRWTLCGRQATQLTVHAFCVLRRLVDGQRSTNVSSFTILHRTSVVRLMVSERAEMLGSFPFVSTPEELWPNNLDQSSQTHMAVQSPDRAAPDFVEVL
jgi:hypothetical protein